MLTDNLDVFYSDFAVEVTREDGSSFRAVPNEKVTETFFEADNRLYDLVAFYIRVPLSVGETIKTGERLTLNGRDYYVYAVRKFRGQNEAFVYLSEDPVNETL